MPRPDQRNGDFMDYRALVTSSLLSIGVESDQVHQIEAGAGIYGDEGLLDSVHLVSLIVAIEEALNKAFDTPVSLFSERDMALLDEFRDAILGVFERHRPMVGAMALGTARGLVDLLERAGAPSEALVVYKLEHEALCRRMNRVAARYEQSCLRAHEASLFKLQAIQFVERVAHSVPSLVPPTVFISSSLLRKKYRDAFAFEYTEGTSNIHVLNAYRAYVASRDNYDTAS